MEDAYLQPGSLSWRQAEVLRRLLGEDAQIAHLSRWEAAGLIALRDPNARWRRFPPTTPQVEFLTSRGQFREGMTRGEASELIGSIMDSWSR